MRKRPKPSVSNPSRLVQALELGKPIKGMQGYVSIEGETDDEGFKIWIKVKVLVPRTVG